MSCLIQNSTADTREGSDDDDDGDQYMGGRVVNREAVYSDSSPMIQEEWDEADDSSDVDDSDDDLIMRMGRAAVEDAFEEASIIETHDGFEGIEGENWLEIDSDDLL